MSTSVLTRQHPVPSGDTNLAYPVPFAFLREHAPIYGLRNASLERLHHVTLSLIGPGRLPEQLPFSLRPGATAWVQIDGDDLAWSTLLIVRWRRSCGDEYLWRASF